MDIADLQRAIEKLNAEFPRPKIGPLEISAPLCLETEYALPYPSGEQPGVYVLFDGRGSIQYIGKASVGLAARLGQHFKRGASKNQGVSIDPNMAAITTVRTIAVPWESSFEASAIEEFLIRELRPPMNVQHK